MFERPFKWLARRRRYEAALAAPRSWPGSGLHVCASCGRSEFVHALDRHQESDARWRLSLRCGQCGSCRDVIVSDDLARRFDADVSRGLAAIASTVTTLDRERMADQTEAFAAALRLDLIDAGDFRPSGQSTEGARRARSERRGPAPGTP